MEVGGEVVLKLLTIVTLVVITVLLVVVMVVIIEGKMVVGGAVGDAVQLASQSLFPESKMIQGM